jgi:type I restriction enzyme S subunit
VSEVLDDVIAAAQLVPLSQAVEVNPKLDRSLLNDDLDVSFVPMAAVEALSGGIDVSTIRKYAEVKKGYTHFRDGDILFAKVTPCMENGKMAIARKLFNGVGFGSTEFHVLRPRAGVDAKYIYYFVSSQTFRKEASGHMTGAVGLRRVPSAYLEEQLIPLPGIDQQREIVAELEKQFSRLDEAVANLQRVKANLKRYKASVLKDAVEGRLVPTEAELARREGRSFESGEQLLQRILEARRKEWKGKGKFKEPTSPAIANLPQLPDSWSWATMPQLGELNRGKSKHRPRDDAALYGGPYPFIQTGDVRRSDGSITEYSQTYSEFGLKQSRLWPIGTLCITIAANIAETGILKLEACFPDSVVGFVSEQGYPTTEYVEFFIRTARDGLDRFASATAQKNINLEVLEAVAVPTPPLAEQRRIVAEVERRLSLVRGVESEVDANLKRAQALRQATLQLSFNGNSKLAKE